MTDGELKKKIYDRLAENVALELQMRAALIICAKDPVQMVHNLKSELSSEDINGGQIPPFYFRLAEYEVQRRQERLKGKH